jgi:hypothetical protein
MHGHRSRASAAVERAPRIRPVDPDPAPARRTRDAATPVAPAIPRARAGAASDDRLSRTWSVVLGLGWPLVLLASVALEPAPADPNAPVPLVVEMANVAAFAALVATSIAAGVRHRAAAVTGVVAGLLLAAFVVACPVSGHHTFGLWWYAELALVVGMLGLSLAALGGRATEGAAPRR